MKIDENTGISIAGTKCFLDVDGQFSQLFFFVILKNSTVILSLNNAGCFV